MTDFEEIIRIFSEAGVECVIVGGLAATIHGSARLTQDVDFVYARNRANLRRLVATLKPHSPVPAGSAARAALRNGTRPRWSGGLDFTLTTAIGDIDLLGEITGGGDYRALVPHSVEVEMFGCRCRCLDLPGLIRTKRAAGRPRDLEALAEMEVLLMEREHESGR